MTWFAARPGSRCTSRGRGPVSRRTPSSAVSPPTIRPILLVVDGVPINLPLHGHVEGYADWSLLTPVGDQRAPGDSGAGQPTLWGFRLRGRREEFTASDAAERAWPRSRRRATATPGGWRSRPRRDMGRDPRARRAAGAGLARQLRLLAGEPRGSRLAPRRVRQESTAASSLYGSSWDSPGFVPVDRYNAVTWSRPPIPPMAAPPAA